MAADGTAAEIAGAKRTNRCVASVRPPAEGRLELFDQDVGGLILSVSPAGRKSWVFRSRTADGIQRRHALGTCPNDFGGAKLGDLVETAERGRLIEDIRAEPIKTIDDLKDAYFQAVETGDWRSREKVKKAGTLLRERQMWATYIAAPLGKLPLESITADTIKRLLRAIVAKGNGATSNRVRALLRQVLNYGVADDRMLANPVS